MTVYRAAGQTFTYEAVKKRPKRGPKPPSKPRGGEKKHLSIEDRKRALGYRTIKARSAKRRWDEPLSYEDWLLVSSQPCHYCKTPYQLHGGAGLDRIDNSLGYLSTNVLPCCPTCNKIRGDNLSVEEMEVAMSAILQYREQLSK